LNPRTNESFFLKTSHGNTNYLGGYKGWYEPGTRNPLFFKILLSRVRRRDQSVEKKRGGRNRFTRRNGSSYHEGKELWGRGFEETREQKMDSMEYFTVVIFFRGDSRERVH